MGTDDRSALTRVDVRDTPSDLPRRYRARVATRKRGVDAADMGRVATCTGEGNSGASSSDSPTVCRQPNSAGWWAGGPRPGQVGAAVILGHVDSTTGPAVFFRLGELEAGDEVLVDRADGTTAHFLVTSLERYHKAEFPSELVYYPTVEAELRLVTCGGPFDSSTGHYRDNVVVFAAQAR
jgi:hypothetical protein